MSMTRVFTCCLFLLVFIPFTGNAQLANRITDLNTFGFNSGSYPRSMVEFKGKLYFVATRRDNYAVEPLDDIYVCDGSLSAEIAPGIAWLLQGQSWDIASDLLVFEDEMFFVTREVNYELKLWQYNGENAPVLVKDLGDGTVNSWVDLGGFEGHVYFPCANVSSGHELWKYEVDGQVSLAADIRAGEEGSYPHKFQVFQDKLLFFADDELGAEELWKYDGENPPMVLTNINPSANTNKTLSDFILFENKAYFYTGGGEFWVYNGAAFPTKVADEIEGVDANFSVKEGYVFNAAIYMRASGSSSSSKMWKFDGEQAPTPIGGLSTSYTIGGFMEYQGDLYFTVNQWLWRCLPSGDLENVSDLFEGNYTSEFYEKFVFQDRLYLSTKGRNSGVELFVMDDALSPELVEDIDLSNEGSDPLYLTRWNNKMCFIAYQDDMHYTSRRIFIYDSLTQEMDVVFPDVVTDNLNGVNSLIGFKDNLVLNGALTGLGEELVVCDETGQSEGYDLETGPQGSNPRFFVHYKDALYFVAEVGGRSTLYVYDGSNPPVEVSAFGSLTSVDISFSPVVFQEALYMGLNNGSSGHELWKFDGSELTLVKDLNPGMPGSNPVGFCVHGDVLYFQASTPEYGEELWRYDGTSTPEQVSDLRSGTLGSSPAHLVSYKEYLYFAADDGIHNKELWRMNNTGSVERVAEIMGFPVADPRLPIVYGDKLYFGMKYPLTQAYHLWRYDGNSSLTVIASEEDAYNLTYYFFAQRPVVYDNTLFFPAYDSFHGTELWSFFSEDAVDVSVPEETQMLTARVYPNPVSGILNIQFPEHCSWVTVAVFDVTGKQLVRQEWSNTKLVSMSMEHPPGVYFVQIQTSSGLLLTNKVIQE